MDINGKKISKQKCPNSPPCHTHPMCKAPPLAPFDSGMPELTPAKEHEDDNVEESGGAWAIVDGTPMLCEAFEGLEYMLAAETADAKALEPCTLAEAK